MRCGDRNALVAALPPLIRWTLLGVGGLFLLILVGAGSVVGAGGTRQPPGEPWARPSATAQQPWAGQPADLKPRSPPSGKPQGASSARASHQGWYLLGNVEFRGAKGTCPGGLR